MVQDVSFNLNLNKRIAGPVVGVGLEIRSSLTSVSILTVLHDFVKYILKF